MAFKVKKQIKFSSNISDIVTYSVSCATFPFRGENSASELYFNSKTN